MCSVGVSTGTGLENTALNDCTKLQKNTLY